MLPIKKRTVKNIVLLYVIFTIAAPLLGSILIFTVFSVSDTAAAIVVALLLIGAAFIYSQFARRVWSRVRHETTSKQIIFLFYSAPIIGILSGIAAYIRNNYQEPYLLWYPLGVTAAIHGLLFIYLQHKTDTIPVVPTNISSSDLASETLPAANTANLPFKKIFIIAGGTIAAVIVVSIAFSLVGGVAKTNSYPSDFAAAKSRCGSDPIIVATSTDLYGTTNNRAIKKGEPFYTDNPDLFFRRFDEYAFFCKTSEIPKDTYPGITIR